MISITPARTPARTSLKTISDLLSTVVQASLCTEIVILAITCVYLYSQGQSPVVLFAFMLIALDRRAREVRRLQASSNSLNEPHYPCCNP